MTRKATPLLAAEALRLLQIERRLQVGNGATFAELEKLLLVSAATVKRDLRLLREQLGAPIFFDRVEGRYRFVDRWVGVLAHLVQEASAA
jgi:predicted DNA-binding transcriptional regulator YafY